MSPMERRSVATLLVVGATFVATAVALAKPKPPVWDPVELANVGDEPGASGEATLTDVMLVGSTYGDSPYGYWDFYTGRLTVECQSLTPGATYWTPAGTVTAHSRGKVQATGEVSFSIGYSLEWSPPYGWHLTSLYEVDVIRLGPDESSVTVLTGKLRPPRSLQNSGAP